MVLFGTKVMIVYFVIISCFLLLLLLGEQNTLYNTDKYACSFTKLIHYWRQEWNERTNGTTDIQFPFGFVQVYTFENIIDIEINYFC